MVQKGEDLPERSSRLFTVVCKGCGCLLLTVERIRDPDIAILEEHLRACAASEPLGDAPMLGEVMARVRITAVEQT